jgi:N-formylmaleamate deformylase
MINWVEGDIDLGEISIHYYRTGNSDKPSLVLCHGFSDNGLCWTRVAERLEPNFDIVMMDARNHGLSSRGNADLASMADDLAGLVSALELDRPILLGHSMGASMVADMVARYPERASRMVLEDPPWTKYQGPPKEADVEARGAGFRKYLASLQGRSTEDVIDFGRKQNPNWHADDLPAWAASKHQVSETAMNGLSLGQWSDTVKNIQCSALLIYADGEGDGIVKHEVARQIVAANAMFRLGHVEGAGHNTRREQFEAYMLVLEDFLLEV